MAERNRKKRYKVVILGGGAGGISVAARLKQELPPSEIAIIEPTEYHFYQPLWTLVGGGIVRKEETRRPQQDVIPEGVRWIRDKVASVDPKHNQVNTFASGVISYDFLVVATGLTLNYDQIKGLKGNLGKDGICSVYQYEQAEITSEIIRSFKGGTAIFAMPPMPIKCAGAPQKIMYLAEETFRNKGLRDQSKVVFASAGASIFGVKEFAEPLNRIVTERNIEPRYNHRLVEVDAKNKKAIFEVLESEGEIPKRVELTYDLLHVVPPMSAHPFIAESGLAVKEGAQKGWLNVDQHTLQHLEYRNVFGVGDVTGIPNSKTGAAVRKQAPVVAENLLSYIKGRDLSKSYDGYSSCPLVTGKGKVILAEFGYNGKLMPSFPIDPTKERWSYWVLKRHLLPQLYWRGMLKGKL